MSASAPATAAGSPAGSGSPAGAGSRLRSYLLFVFAVFYYFVARSLAHHGAEGLAGILWSPLLEQAMQVFLLLFGYAAMGFWFQRQLHPISAQGLPRRPGFPAEFGLGLATGWGIALICVLPMAIAGGIAVVLTGRLSEWGWLLPIWPFSCWPHLLRRSRFAATPSSASSTRLALLAQPSASPPITELSSS